MTSMFRKFTLTRSNSRTHTGASIGPQGSHSFLGDVPGDDENPDASGARGAIPLRSASRNWSSKLMVPSPREGMRTITQRFRLFRHSTPTASGNARTLRHSVSNSSNVSATDRQITPGSDAAYPSEGSTGYPSQEEADPAYKTFVEAVLARPNVKQQQNSFLMQTVQSAQQAPAAAGTGKSEVQEKLAMVIGYRDVLVRECWKAARQDREQRNEAMEEREQECNRLTIQAQGMKKQGLTMQTALLEELTWLRDQQSGLGELFRDACSQPFADPIDYLDGETRKLVESCVSERLKRSFVEMEKGDSSDSILSVMLQEKISQATTALLIPVEAELQKLRAEHTQGWLARRSLENELLHLADTLQLDGRGWPPRSDTQSPGEQSPEQERKEAIVLGEAIVCLRDLGQNLEEAKHEVQLAKQAAARSKLESEEAREALEEALKMLAASPDPLPTTHYAPPPLVRTPTPPPVIEGNESRPVLPGATAAVLLSHAEGLKESAVENPIKAVDIVRLLGRLISKSDEEFTEMISRMAASDTLVLCIERLRVSRLEDAAMRGMCATLLEELIGLNLIMDGRGQPQNKVHMFSKRLTLSMQVIQSNISACVSAAKRRPRQVEDTLTCVGSLASPQSASKASHPLIASGEVVDFEDEGFYQSENSDSSRHTATSVRSRQKQSKVAVKDLGQEVRVPSIRSLDMSQCSGGSKHGKKQKSNSSPVRTHSQSSASSHPAVAGPSGRNSPKSAVMLELEQPAVQLRTTSVGSAQSGRRFIVDAPDGADYISETGTPRKGSTTVKGNLSHGINVAAGAAKHVVAGTAGAAKTAAIGTAGAAKNAACAAGAAAIAAKSAATGTAGAALHLVGHSSSSSRPQSQQGHGSSSSRPQLEVDDAAVVLPASSASLRASTGASTPSSKKRRASAPTS